MSLALTSELGWLADVDGRGHHAGFGQVVGIGFAASSRLSLSAELWGASDWDPDVTGKQVSANGSAAYLVGDTIQLDAGANFGLNRQNSGRADLRRRVETVLIEGEGDEADFPGWVRGGSR